MSSRCWPLFCCFWRGGCFNSVRGCVCGAECTSERRRGLCREGPVCECIVQTRLIRVNAYVRSSGATCTNRLLYACEDSCVACKWCSSKSGLSLVTAHCCAAAAARAMDGVSSSQTHMVCAVYHMVNPECACTVCCVTHRQGAKRANGAGSKDGGHWRNSQTSGVFESCTLRP